MDKNLYFNITLSVIKGIGFRNAQAIYNEFGDQSFDIIKTNIKKLSEIENIGHKKAQLIREKYDKNKEKVDDFVFMIELGFTFDEATLLYKKYKKKTVNILENEIYSIFKKIDNIKFSKIDDIAINKLNYSKTNEKRILNGIVQYINEEHNNTSSTVLDKNRIIKKISKLLSIDNLDIYYNKLLENNLIVEPEKNMVSSFIVNDVEKFIAKDLLSRNETYFAMPIPSDFLNKEQKDAVFNSIEYQVSIITGGAGTGKTTVLKEVLNNLKEQNVLLCAPTGKAAQRMTEATGYEAKTIHKILDFNPVNLKYRKNSKDKLECDVLIIDEASMVDIFLFANLLLATNKETRIIIVGDKNQIPSIDMGNLLNDLIESNSIETTELKKIERTSLNSDIVNVSSDIINKNLNNQYNNGDYFFIESDNDFKTNSLLKTIIQERIEKAFNIDCYKDLQVLTPINDSDIGSNLLNKQLQPILNKNYDNEKTIQFGDKEFSVGDKVIQIRNNYDKEIFNGETGIITSVEKKRIFVLFGDREIKYRKSELDELKLCYAMTVHKSQGSEYKATIIVLPENDFNFIDRGLIYTAITRSKELCIIIAKKELFNKYCLKNKIKERNTLLQKYLKQKTH